MFTRSVKMPVELANFGEKALNADPNQRITTVGKLCEEPLFRAAFPSIEDFTLYHGPARSEAARNPFFRPKYPQFQKEYGSCRPAAIQPAVAFGGAVIPQGEQDMSAGCLHTYVRGFVSRQHSFLHV